MNWPKILRRWTMRSIHGAILGAVLLGSASVVMAQAPAMSAVAPVSKNYFKSQSFNLPVRMEPADRALLNEIQLWVRAPGATWKLQEQASAQTEFFKCRVPQDGEYWYTLVTVDRSGRPSIRDVNLEPPSLRVVVDSAPPLIQVQSGNTPDGDLCLKCTVLDANPDHSTLRAVCRTETAEIPLEMVPNQPGSFRVKGPEMLRYPIVVSAMDLAKNVGTREVSLRDMIGATPEANPNQGKGPAEIAQVSGRTETKVFSPGPSTSIDTPPKIDPYLGFKNEGPAPSGSNPRGDFPPQTINGGLPLPGTSGNELPRKFPLVAAEPVKHSSMPQELINTTYASVKYRIDQVGPSGVGKVEIFMTPDNGQTWHRLADHAGKQSPADIQLPGDGVYGIRIVVTNGNGFGGKTPVRGDAPHCLIEVDTTAPFVRLGSTEVVPASGHVEIRWNASDKNLGTEPVTLSYRTAPDGPWQVIARTVKNDGLYRWAFPRDAGGQFFFKIEVTDAAGNLSQDMSRQPVVIDMSEPRATVVGVSGGGAPRQ